MTRSRPIILALVAIAALAVGGYIAYDQVLRGDDVATLALPSAATSAEPTTEAAATSGAATSEPAGETGVAGEWQVADDSVAGYGCASNSRTSPPNRTPSVERRT